MLFSGFSGFSLRQTIRLRTSFCYWPSVESGRHGKNFFTMKKFKFFLLLASVCGALTFAGCSDDDDNDIDLGQLTGKWECYKVYYEFDDRWDTYLGEGKDLFVYEFRGDGTGAFLDDYVYTAPWEEITYSIDGQMLTIVYSSNNFSESWRIDQLNSSELVLADDEVEEEKGQYTTNKYYFKRVN